MIEITERERYIAVHRQLKHDERRHQEFLEAQRRAEKRAQLIKGKPLSCFYDYERVIQCNCACHWNEGGPKNMCSYCKEFAFPPKSGERLWRKPTRTEFPDSGK